MVTVVPPTAGANHDDPADITAAVTSLESSTSTLDELVRAGARQMLAAAIQAEVDTYIDAHTHELDEDGYRMVVRNGHHRSRAITTAAGAVGIKQPRVNDRRIDPDTGQRRRFASAIIPKWARKSSDVSEVLPLLYLRGLSTGDFAPALEQFLGTGAGLSPPTITRMTTQWQSEARDFAGRDLSGTDFVYVWVDGIHLKVRLEQDKICLLVMIGVRSDGQKELIACADGYRESEDSWAEVLRDCRRRGMAAPVLAIGDGALGFWNAVRDVFPETREQRCWFHKMGNVLAALPKSVHAGAKVGLRQIMEAEDRGQAEKAAKVFIADYGTKWPKAVAKIEDDLDVLLEFYNYPAAHWIHLRTTKGDRVDLRHRAPTATGHQGPRLKGRGVSDGLQTPPSRRAPMESHPRPTPGRPSARRSHLRKWNPRPTRPRIRPHHQRPPTRRLTSHPQHLTIPLKCL